MSDVARGIVASKTNSYTNRKQKGHLPPKTYKISTENIPIEEGAR